MGRLLLGLALAACLGLFYSKAEGADKMKPIFYAKIADMAVDSPEMADFPQSVKDGLKFLKTADLDQLPIGRTEIDGDRVFANVMEYETHPAGDEVSESHKKYYDIQCIIRGQEMQACVPYSAGLPVKVPYNEEGDYALYDPAAMPFWADGSDFPSKITLHDKEFTIFAPGEVHTSGICPEKPEKIFKVVVKCRAEE